MVASIKVDERQSKMGGVLFFASVFSAFFTASMVFVLISIWRASYRGDVANKIEVLGLYSFGLLLGIYGCVGIYQILTTERREKFIVRQVTFDGESIELDGIFSKKTRFTKNDIMTIEPYKTKVMLRQLMTLLDWRGGVYLIKLKNSRTFYLSKALVDEISSLLPKGGVTK